jgi:hypothetical protein
VLGQRTGVSNTGETQRPPEGAAPLRQREASRIRMHMGPPTRQSAERIRLEPEMVSRPGRDEPQQFGGRRAHATTDTGTCRDVACRASHLEVYP